MERTQGDVHPKYHFVLKNGQKVKNLHELHSSMKDMDDITFNHHVNDFKNDFHNWVRDIHKDGELANSLLASKTKKEMADVLKRRVKELGNIKNEVKAIETKTEDKPVKKIKKKKTVKKKAAKEAEKGVEKDSPKEEPKKVMLDARAPNFKDEVVKSYKEVVTHPALMRFTVGDFALGLLIGALAGIIISRII